MSTDHIKRAIRAGGAAMSDSYPRQTRLPLDHVHTPPSPPRASTPAFPMTVHRTLKPRGLNPPKTTVDALLTSPATGQLPPLPDANIADG